MSERDESPPVELLQRPTDTYHVGVLAEIASLCVPVMAIVQRSLYNTGLPQELRAAIVLILLGVVLGVLTDAQLNLTGVAFAVASIAATVGSQVLTNKRQKDCISPTTQHWEQPRPLSSKPVGDCADVHKQQLPIQRR